MEDFRVGINVSRKDGVIYLDLKLGEDFDLKSILIRAKVPTDLGEKVLYQSNTHISGGKISEFIESNKGGGNRKP